MERLARIQETYEDGTALVRAVCMDCRSCGGCGSTQKQALFRVKNPIDAHLGELVTVTEASGLAQIGAAVLYLMPLILFLAGYYAGNALWNAGAVTGSLAFAAYIICAAIWNRTAGKKQKTVYTITGYPSADVLESQIKGDNDLD